MKDYPEYALTELRADVIHRFRLLTTAGVKGGEQFDRLKKRADDSRVQFPELISYSVDPVPLEKMIDPSGSNRDLVYAHNYRSSKQVSHGTIVSWDDILPWKGEDHSFHVAFASSKEHANEILGSFVGYSLSFLSEFLWFLT